MHGLFFEVACAGERRRIELQRGRTRLGSGDCEARLDVPLGEELHFWSDPPKLLFVGREAAPEQRGQSFRELALVPGSSFRWRQYELVLGAKESVLVEESEVMPEPIPQRGEKGPSSPGQRAWLRLYAGLLVELGLAEKQATRRAQAAIAEQNYDHDILARELLAGQSAEPPASVLERAARLQRDLIMSPLQSGLRGASRRMRRRVQGGMAWIIVQIVSILLYSLLLAAFALIARARYQTSLDGALDRVLGALRFGG